MKYSRSENITAQETLDYIKRCREYRPKEWLNQIAEHCPHLFDAMDKHTFIAEVEDALSNLFYEIKVNANNILDSEEL
jgi:hypothetical protein